MGLQDKKKFGWDGGTVQGTISHSHKSSSQRDRLHGNVCTSGQHGNCSYCPRDSCCQTLGITPDGCA